MKKTVELGTIVVPNQGNAYGTLYIGDPCYFPLGDFPVLWEAVLVRSGKWTVGYIEEGAHAPQSLFVVFAEESSPSSLLHLEEVGTLGVDSGQMAVITQPLMDVYRTKGDAFYNRICDLNQHNGGIWEDKGAVSHTAFGDGVYPLLGFRTRDTNEIACLLVDFVPPWLMDDASSTSPRIIDDTLASITRKTVK